MAVFSIFVALLVFCTVYFSLQNFALRRRRATIKKANGCKEPPHMPLKDPLFGIDYFLDGIQAFRENRAMKRIRDHLDKYGSTYYYPQLGNDWIATKDPENIKTIMATDFASYGVQPDRYLPMKPMVGESFFTVDGPHWKDSRERIKPVISRNEFSDLARLEVHVRRFLDLIPRDGSTIDMAPLCVRLLNDYMTEYLFGKSTDSLTLEATVDQKAITESIHKSLSNSTSRFVIGSFLGPLLEYIPLPKDVVSAIRVVHEYIDGTVLNALQAQSDENSAPEKAGHYVFLQEMVKNTSDKKFLRELSLTLYVGGTDTTANVLGHMIWALSRHTSVVEKLREETSTLQGQEVDLAALQKLPYLKAVINETMRVYPIAPSTNRTCTADTMLPHGGGPDGLSPIFVKKGTRILLGFQARHYDKKVWGEDAEEFRPERWLDHKAQTWDFMPFGGGGRICPGQHLALANLSYILVRMLQEFKMVENRDDRGWKEELRLVATNANGALVSFTPA